LRALEEASTLELQSIRSDLYFVHAAVAAKDDLACIFAADSGSGKSTIVRALTHHGWRYLSDELAPIDPASNRVIGYPRAIWLKHPPAPPDALPDSALRTADSIHVPVPQGVWELSSEGVPLAAIFFLRYAGRGGPPLVQPIGLGESAARLYAHGLNQLAHNNRGLEVVVRIARPLPAFIFETGELSTACAMVTTIVQAMRPRSCDQACG
jgi:hypothetical protein